MADATLTSARNPVFVVSANLETTGTYAFVPFERMANQAFLASSAHGQLVHREVLYSSIRLEIVDLHDEDYVLRRPIPVILQLTDDEEFLASVENANIAMTGVSAIDSLKTLREHITLLYGILCAERLGPEPQKQLKVLEAYIGKKETKSTSAT